MCGTRTDAAGKAIVIDGLAGIEENTIFRTLGRWWRFCHVVRERDSEGDGIWVICYACVITFHNPGARTAGGSSFKVGDDKALAAVDRLALVQ